jgi:3-(3-hydroxy-phenyl)propionate hydroxylase
MAGYLQLFAEDEAQQYGSIEGVRQWISKVMDKKYADRITWVSMYQFHQAVARSFTDEHCRVVLAGEAAHLFAPFGARGMNSGVADAIVAVKAIHAAFQAGERSKAKQIIAEAAQERKTAA